MELAVEIRNVSKVFTIKHNPSPNLKVRFLGMFSARNRETAEQFWALRDVDLIVRKGESVGLVGPNGSGKSTLLRVMAGIFPPTSGDLVVRGRVAPMIELGVGFNPELSGRENIYLNTSLYRLSRRETDAIYHQIVAFSELEQFIDTPVKNYSTGMYARLGFSVAVHLDPEILLIDEVLSVGDERFQAKCVTRMDELRHRGTTIVLVSHSAETVERMCDRACLLLHGRKIVEGAPTTVIEEYRAALGMMEPVAASAG
jgi:ABC-type polysaccharide/polyol phosphate transport system ATPase subunit